jgi:hypothetical protein
MVVRKLAISVFVICLVLVAVPTVLYGSLQLQSWHFHQAHRLLREMHAVQSESTNESAPAREVLLQTVPLGAGREGAIAALRNEGFGCQTIAEPITETRLRLRLLADRGLPNTSDSSRTRKGWLDCQALAPNVIGNRHWIVDLEFDAEGHLNDAGVAMWNIFL